MYTCLSCGISPASLTPWHVSFRSVRNLFSSAFLFGWWSGQAKRWVHPQVESPMGMGSWGTPKWMPDEIGRYSKAKMTNLRFGAIKFDPFLGCEGATARRAASHAVGGTVLAFFKMGSRNCPMVVDGGDFVYDLDDIMSLVFASRQYFGSQYFGSSGISITVLALEIELPGHDVRHVQLYIWAAARSLNRMEKRFSF